MQAHPGYLKVVLQWTDVASVVWEYRYQSHADRSWSSWTSTSSDGGDAIVSVRNLTDKQPYTFEVRATLSGVNGAVASIDATPAAQQRALLHRSVAYQRGLKPGTLDLEPGLSSASGGEPRPMLIAERLVSGTFELTVLFRKGGTNLALSDFTVAPANAATLANLQSRPDPSLGPYDRWTLDVTPAADGRLTIGVIEHAVPQGNDPGEITLTVNRATPARVGYMAFSSANASRYSEGPYSQGDTIDLTLHFSEQVTVTGSPMVKIKVQSTELDTVYHSGSGSDALVFRYAVVAGSPTTGRPLIVSREIELGSATIVGSNGASADLKLPPVVSSFELIQPEQPQGLQAGDVYEYRLIYSEPVTVVGRPQLQLKILLERQVEQSSVPADYIEGSGSDTLVFRYVVPPNHGLLDPPGFSPVSYVQYPDRAAITSAVTPHPVDAYPRLPGQIKYLGLSDGGSLTFRFPALTTWPAWTVDITQKTPSMDIVLSTDQPTLVEISRSRFTRTLQDHEARSYTTLTVTASRKASDLGDTAILIWQIDSPEACCGWHGARGELARLRIMPQREEEPNPEVVLRSETLALARDLDDPQLLCFPTRTLEDCAVAPRAPRRGSLAALGGFAPSILHTLDERVANTAFEFYTVTETSAQERWSSRFRRGPDRELRHSEGEQHFRINPGLSFFDLRLWLVYPHPERDTNSVRLGLGPFDPPLTVCFPLPTNAGGIPFLAAWENEHRPWEERRWALLDGVANLEPFQICAVTRFATVFVVLRSDDPVAGLSELKFGRPIYWRAGQPISASELMAALPSSTVLIRADLGGESHHYLRSAGTEPVPGFPDFTIAPGQEIIIFR